MAKSTTRIVIKDSDKPLIQDLQALTGVSTASEVVSLLLSRYGSHFADWFKFDDRHCHFPGVKELNQMPSLPEPSSEVVARTDETFTPFEL